jgi:hypothetical protein
MVRTLLVMAVTDPPMTMTGSIRSEGLNGSAFVTSSSGRGLRTQEETADHREISLNSPHMVSSMM